jgi:TrmH family RNA methyltransferase
MNSEGPLKPLKWYKGLADSKNRLEAGFFLVEGERAISQVIVISPGSLAEILATQEFLNKYPDYKVREMTEAQLKSVSSTRTPQGIIAVVRLPLETYSPQLPPEPGRKILFLEDVQDPGNAGTLIRTAAAFDFSGVILTDKCADPFSPKVVQSSAGTVLSLWLRRTGGYPNLLEALKKRGYQLIATDLKGRGNPAVLKNSRNFILALGNEASGLSNEILEKADFQVRIPINQKKAESLNVALSGAIFMYLSSDRN